jgi:hypothetical protein
VPAIISTATRDRATALTRHAQVAVSFALSASKWLDEQRAEMRKSMPWRRALAANGEKAVEGLFGDDKRTTVSKSEFRRGVSQLGSHPSALPLLRHSSVPFPLRLDVRHSSALSFPLVV